MSRILSHRVWARVMGLVLVVGLPAWAAAQTPRDRGETARASGLPAEVQAAHGFLFSLYPELLTRELAITLTPVGEAWLVEVADAPAAVEPLLTATMAFDRSGQLQHFSARGVLVDQVRHDLLWQQVRDHPEWADSDAEVWLTGIGGRPTIGQPAPETTRVEQQPWRTFLGTSVATERARFRWRIEDDETAAGPSGPRQAPRVDLSTLHRAGGPPAPPVPLPAVRPSWVVETRGVDADGNPVRYRLEYEPFGGRLIGAVRQ